jgi:ABC-2 type transport system ATP-binding protein
LIELATDNVQAASDCLKEAFAGWRVAIFGDRLHLVLDNPDEEFSKVEQNLEKNNIQIYYHRPIPFSLEDAFIGIVQRASQ